MRPVFIRAKGFRSYGHLDLDLSDIHSLLIFGPKGSGKSSILDAILWALTGKSTSADSRGHVRLGADLCQVEIGFTHAGSLYRVTRTQSLKTARGKSDLQLAVWSGYDGDGDPFPAWIPKGGKGIDETEAEIERIIGMGYEGLTCGPFSLQDQAGKFLDPPELRIDGKVYRGRSARLQVFVKMMGLSGYEQLRGAATTEARDLDAKAGTLEAQVASADITLASRPEAVSALSQAESTIQTARQVAQEAQGLIEALTGQVGALQAEIESGRRQCAGLAADQKALADLGASQHAKEAALTRYRGILDHRAEIEAKAAESEVLSKQADALRLELAGIEAEIKGLESQKAPAEARLKAAKEKLDGIQGRLSGLQKRLAKRGELETKVELLKRARADRETANAGVQTTDELIASTRTSRDGITKANAGAQEGRGRILAEEKKTKAQADGLLPLIRGHEKRTAVMGIVPCIGIGDLSDRCPLLADARESVGPLSELRTRHAALCAWERPTLPEVHLTDELDASLKALTGRKAADQGRLTALESEIRTLIPAEAEIAGLDALAGEVPRLEEEERTTTAGVDSLIAEVTHLEIEAAAHRGGLMTRRANLIEIEADIKGRARWVSLVPEIGLAERELPRIEADLVVISQQICDLKARIEEARAVQQDLAVKDQALTVARGNLEVLRVRGSLARADESVATAAAAQHRAALTGLEKLAEEREAAAKEAGALRSRHSLLVALAEAYRQIPVMILETMAVPILEEEVNRALLRYSPNKAQVRIETQREIKSRDTLADGLEIYVRDVVGERPIDSFSGGQRFDLFLAFRVGLAKLQARRSGAGVECLVVDEGWGSQDAGSLQEMVEALKEMRKDYPLFIAISHVEAMKEAFENHLLVSGGPEDSRAELVTA